MVTLLHETDTYLEWIFKEDTTPSTGTGCSTGFIILMKDEAGWNIELMGAIPLRKGIGTLLLNTARTYLFNEALLFCPVTEESKAFFKKHRAVGWVLPSLCSCSTRQPLE